MRKRRSVAAKVAYETIVHDCACSNRDELRARLGELMSSCWHDGYKAAMLTQQQHAQQSLFVPDK